MNNHKFQLNQISSKYNSVKKKSVGNLSTTKDRDLLAFKHKLKAIQKQITTIQSQSAYLKEKRILCPNDTADDLDLLEKIRVVRLEWIDLMMQMQENNEGVQKMTNSLYYAVVKRMNKDIVSISGYMYVTSPLSDSEGEGSPDQRNNHQ